MKILNRNTLRRTAAVLLLVVIFASLSGCKRVGKVVRQEFSQLAPICELATLKCYYHNVANHESGQKSLFRLGYEKIWLEYSGIVSVGIDASRVKVKLDESREGVVQVTIPPAQVLNIDFDENSIHKLTDSGLFSSVSSKDEAETFAAAQEDMEETARANHSILAQAQNRAKKVLEKYIQKCGEAVGKTYTVEWIELDDDSSAPEAQPAPSDQPSASA